MDPELDVCFINGLDGHGKTWLQIAYPLFIIVMVSCVILLSKTSLQFFNRATLAILILLSDMKFLRIVIRALSFASTLMGHNDGSVHYLL